MLQSKCVAYWYVQKTVEHLFIIINSLLIVVFLRDFLLITVKMWSTIRCILESFNSSTTYLTIVFFLFLRMKISFKSESTWKELVRETYHTSAKNPKLNSKMVPIQNVRFLASRIGGCIPKGNHSYTVLCLLSWLRLSPITSEEWDGKSINIPSGPESADSSTCPIMVSGLDDSLGGVEDAPLLRSVIVIVASVPWRAPEEWSGRMEGDSRGKSMALAPACTIPMKEIIVDY